MFRASNFLTIDAENEVDEAWDLGFRVPIASLVKCTDDLYSPAWRNVHCMEMGGAGNGCRHEEDQCNRHVR